MNKMRTRFNELSNFRLAYRGMISRQRIRRFKDFHKGEKCFILGNGPSLAKLNLSLLRNEITFGLNRIYLLFPKMGFQTTYFVSVNRLVMEQFASDISNLQMFKFLSWQNRDLISFNKKMAFLKTIGGLPSFSFDPANVVWESGTVTYVAIQLAYYMGFSKVILIGVDHSFNTKGAANMTVISKGKDLNHFTPDYFKEGCRWQLPDLQTSELGYGLAKKVFEEDDRKIVDATLGGKLEVFPKLHFENIFESE